MLVDICGVDYIAGKNSIGIYPSESKTLSSVKNGSSISLEEIPQNFMDSRFEVVYHFLSLKINQRLRVKIAIDQDQTPESLISIFNSSCWFEREVFDMFGITFINTPDCRRILTDYGFQGHPLRKDFPLSGLTQLRYDQDQAKIVYEDVNLAQSYRSFDFESPWKSAVYSIKNNT